MSTKTLTPIRGRKLGVYISTDDKVSFSRVGNVTSKGHPRTINTIDVTTDECLQHVEMIPELEDSTLDVDFVFSRQVISGKLNGEDLQGLVDNKTLFWVKLPYTEGSVNDVITMQQCFFTSFNVTGDGRDVIRGNGSIQFTGEKESGSVS
jgi:hypothetical protein